MVGVLILVSLSSMDTGLLGEGMCQSLGPWDWLKN